jgi:hypothetical protein
MYYMRLIEVGEFTILALFAVFISLEDPRSSSLTQSGQMSKVRLKGEKA